MRRAPIAALLFALLVPLIGPPAPVGAVTATEAEAQLLGWINAAREDRGLVPLVRWGELSSIAGSRASRMASLNQLSHTAAGSLSARLDAEGVRWVRYGETIGWSTAGWPASAALALYRSWRSSAPHWALLMSSHFNYVGVGLALRSSNSRTYGSVVLTESPDHSGAIGRVTDVGRNGDDVTWTWTGADRRLQTHTAGLRDFDVQYRISGGSWVWLRDNTTARTITVRDRAHGRSHFLRVRATDQRGNVGAWSNSLGIYVP